MTERIVIRGTNWVGDSIITIPALREIRRIFPTAELTLLARPWVTGIFEGTDLIDDVLTYDSRTESFWSCVAKIRREHFDTAFLFQNALEAAALVFAGRVNRRVGYPTESRGVFLTDSIPLAAATRRKHQIFYYLDLISRFEETLTGTSRVDFTAPDYRLPVAESARRAVRDRLVGEGLDPNKRWIAVCPGATNSNAKRWPAEYFAALCDRLLDRDDTEVCLIGAGNELDVSQAVLSHARRPVTVLTGKTSLSESIAFLTWCDLVVSNDTGPAYISAALDRPLLTIFGPTDPNMISPFSPHARMARKLVHCAPCMLRECPIDHRCLRGLSADEVFRVATEMLEPS